MAVNNFLRSLPASWLQAIKMTTGSVQTPGSAKIWIVLLLGNKTPPGKVNKTNEEKSFSTTSTQPLPKIKIFIGIHKQCKRNNGFVPNFFLVDSHLKLGALFFWIGRTDTDAKPKS